MKKIKPQTPKGVRDFLPDELAKRNVVLDIIKKNFHLFGFEPIYTSAIETLETLTQKYGDEGDKLIFKILNSGDFVSEKVKQLVNTQPIDQSEITREISNKGLRYDLTVPLARFVSQHQNELNFPFKRYQVAPVWRADRPQKGRYREFVQCDADIVGKNGILADVEIINLVLSVFSQLKLDVQVKINNRKIYNGLCQDLNIENDSLSVSTILDKWDKIGQQNVLSELTDLLGDKKANQVLDVFTNSSLSSLNINNEMIRDGVEEVRYILDNTNDDSLVFDIKLLRGLDYYTGTVLEVVSTEVDYGSLLGGGRYENLTEIFGLKNMSGIGISFGLDRICDVLALLDKMPKDIKQQKFLALYMDGVPPKYNLAIASTIRELGLPIDLYPQKLKMDKQLSFADKTSYTHAIIVGEEEVQKDVFIIKDLHKKQQKQIKYSDFLKSPSIEALTL